jgi:hypothetical protein
MNEQTAHGFDPLRSRRRHVGHQWVCGAVPTVHDEAESILYTETLHAERHGSITAGAGAYEPEAVETRGVILQLTLVLVLVCFGSGVDVDVGVVLDIVSVWVCVCLLNHICVYSGYVVVVVP